MKNVNKRVFYQKIKNVYKRLLQLWVKLPMLRSWLPGLYTTYFLKFVKFLFIPMYRLVITLAYMCINTLSAM